MLVNEFIDGVAQGTLHSNDIIEYGSRCKDLNGLIWDLRLSYIGVDDGTGKPRVIGDQQISRIDNAISLLEKHLVDPHDMPNVNVGTVTTKNKTTQDLNTDTKEQDLSHNYMKRFCANSYTEQELMCIYERFKQMLFIEPNTEKEDWLAVFGKTIAPFNPITWTTTVKRLAVFIDKFMGNENSSNLWEITKDTFLIDGKQPKISTLKSKASNVRNGYINPEPPLDAIMNDIKHRRSQ